MATALRRQRSDSFEILQDYAAIINGTQMNVESHVPRQDEDEDEDDADHADNGADYQEDEADLEAHQKQQQQQDQRQQRQHRHQQNQDHPHNEQQATQGEEAEEYEAQGDLSDDDKVEDSVREDMEKLQSTFPGFRNQYRLIKRIGEGTFSTVYKAQDLQYDRFDNQWDPDKENYYARYAHPPRTAEEATRLACLLAKPKYVAIKKIYVTSSPHRILNELDLLHSLRRRPGVCPLITAFRHHDQVVAILPYFRHSDFRDYFRDMTVVDMAIYMSSLFRALSSVHAQGILHRDIKPTNFLYDPAKQEGVLVDFGLAEREGSDQTSRRCLCHEEHAVRKHKLRTAVALAGNTGPQGGYPKEDRRPSRRANRAGTRGFRAPEVLFKCTEQTPKIDVWSAGVILLTILSRRFPFFNSADDVEAMIEIATIFGQRKMKSAAQLHGCMLETSIPTIGTHGFSLERIILWSTCRIDSGSPLTAQEKLAVDFLERCMELDPSRRLSAEDALSHEFLAKWHIWGGDPDEMDVLQVE